MEIQQSKEITRILSPLIDLCCYQQIITISQHKLMPIYQIMFLCYYLFFQSIISYKLIGQEIKTISSFIIICSLETIIIIQYLRIMGFLKIVAFIALPLSAMTYASFSLGKELPKATRIFGNYIGLSYVYFKCILKILKPQDKMPYQMIEVARKASQQSQALRRQLRNTVKRAKQDFKLRKDQTLANFDNKLKQNTYSQNKQTILGAETQYRLRQNKQGKEQQSGSQLMKDLIITRENVASVKKSKKQSRKFFEDL